MNRTLILYKSQTGFTQKYAQWAADDLACALAPWGRSPMRGYHTIVFGTRAHAGRADGLKQALSAYEKSGAQRLVLFVTGAMPNAAQETIQQFWEQNLTQEQRAAIPHFYFQAGLCYERMGFLDRAMMKGLMRFLDHKADKTPEEAEMQKTIAGSYDISDRALLKPMLELLRESTWPMGS